ncbi:MAG: N(G),N(G)-dimethylarginine dimethylaminohydrolase, partial [Candidatus Thorarchaeota archaeon]
FPGSNQVSREFIVNPHFQDYNIIKVDVDESYAANCIRVNDYVLIAKGYEKLPVSISNLGYQLFELDMTEFRKMDGGLSCLSLRF